MADLGTVSILVDVRGQPIVRELATDLNNVAVAETKVSAATQKVMADLQRTRDIMANVKKTTDDTSASFQRFSARELQQAGQRMQGFETALANTRRGMGQMGMATQQVGYQVGDFLVQIQSGTNFMVAFGQQATQLVGILPAFSKQLGMSVGSLIGISSVLGIAIPLFTAIGAAFMRTSSEADSSSDSVNAYSEALKGLQSSLKDTQVEIDKLSFGVSDPAMTAALKALGEAEITLAQARANQRRIGNAIVPTSEEAATLREAVLNFTQMAALVRELEAKNAALAEAQNMLNGGLSVAAGIQKGLVYDKQVELRNAKELIQSYSSQLGIMGRTKAESEAMAEAASRAGLSAQQLSHIDFSNISTAATEALRLAGNLGISLDTASKLAALGPQGIGGNDPSGGTYSGRGGAPSQAAIVGMRVAGAFGYTPVPTAKGGSGRSGGGAGADRLTSLLDSLQSEREVIEEWYAESQTLLQSASDSELSLIGGRNEAKLRLEQEYQEKLKGIRDLGNQTALGQAQTFFGDMASALQGGNDKMLKASRAFAAVEATINAYRAYAQTIADPSLPWWAKIPKALAVLSAGMSVVSAIKGGGSSGGAGGRGSATVSSPTASSPAPQTVFIDSLDPDGLYSGQALINLFDAFYDENDKRGKVFVVAR